jgi:hypothetical protein
MDARASHAMRSKAIARSRKMSSRPTTRVPRQRETEGEWRDPDHVSAAMRPQGMLPRDCPGKAGSQKLLNGDRCAPVENWENASYRYGRRTLCRDLSTSLRRCASSASVEMTAFGGVELRKPFLYAPSCWVLSVGDLVAALPRCVHLRESATMVFLRVSVPPW